MNELGKPTYQHTIGKKGDPVSATVNVELPDSISDKDLRDIAMVTASIEHNLETLSSLAIKAKEKATVCPVEVGDYVDAVAFNEDGVTLRPNQFAATRRVVSINNKTKQFSVVDSYNNVSQAPWSAIGKTMVKVSPNDVVVNIDILGPCYLSISSEEPCDLIATPCVDHDSFHVIDMDVLSRSDDAKTKCFLFFVKDVLVKQAEVLIQDLKA